MRVRASEKNHGEPRDPAGEDRVARDSRAVIVAEALAPSVAAATGRSLDRVVARMKGEQLEFIRFRHPLFDRDSLKRSGLTPAAPNTTNYEVKMLISF